MEYPYFTIYEIGCEEEKITDQDIGEIVSLADEYLGDGVKFVVIKHVSRTEQVVITEFIINKCFDDYFQRGEFFFDEDGNLEDTSIPEWVEAHDLYDAYLSDEREEYFSAYDRTY